MPDPTSHTEPPPPTSPPPPPPGSPPKQPSPPKEPYPNTEMRDASHVSDSLSPKSYAAKGEKSPSKGEHEKSRAEGETQQQLAEDSISSSSSNDREGFLDISFLQDDPLPLVAGELSDVESEEEGNLQTGKRKSASVSAEKHPDPSDAGSSRPKKKRRTIEELAADWGMSVEEAKALSAEHVASLKNIAIENVDAEMVKKVAATEGGCRFTKIVIDNN